MPNVYWGVPGAAADGANPSILMVGDSWFWYPMDNLATEISAAFPAQTLVVVGKNGAEAAQWSDKYRKDIDFGLKLYASGVKALMLSGGGNDVAGMSDFTRLLKVDCSAAADCTACFRPGQPDAIIAIIIGAYREVILRFRAYNPNAPVLLHNYDYAWPTGQGLFGPADWLLEPMAAAKVPEALRHELFKELLLRLRSAQLALAQEPAMGRVIPVQTGGTMPSGAADMQQWWANELHPTPGGFKLLVREAFAPQLRQIGLV